MFLSLIFKFKIVDINGVAVFNAQFLQPGKQTAFAELQIEVIPGFVVVKIDVFHQPFQIPSGDQPGAAVMLHLKAEGSEWASMTSTYSGS